MGRLREPRGNAIGIDEVVAAMTGVYDRSSQLASATAAFVEQTEIRECVQRCVIAIQSITLSVDGRARCAQAAVYK